MIDIVLKTTNRETMVQFSMRMCFPGADINSDHNLVISSFKSKLKRLPRPTTKLGLCDVEDIISTS